MFDYHLSSNGDGTFANDSEVPLNHVKSSDISKNRLDLPQFIQLDDKGMDKVFKFDEFEKIRG